MIETRLVPLDFEPAPASYFEPARTMGLVYKNDAACRACPPLMSIRRFAESACAVRRIAVTRP